MRARIALRHRLNDSIGGRHRLGRGFIALFAGASGTGKTMAAELLAREQGVDLYKVDLALVVSKYVGETEQRLREMFAEAQSLDAIVFFDEADALFGRRGDVKEARDRWANLEVNYLLQAVEEHDGVVILATNLKHGLDEAFARRIHAVIEFPLPDAAARLELWRRALPEPLLAPPEHELQELAQRLELSGAAIRNIAVDAIFRAAEADPAQGGAGPLQVQLRHLVHAAAREYQKLGRPIGESEFGPLWCAWARADLC